MLRHGLPVRHRELGRELRRRGGPRLDSASSNLRRFGSASAAKTSGEGVGAGTQLERRRPLGERRLDDGDARSGSDLLELDHHARPVPGEDEEALLGDLFDVGVPLLAVVPAEDSFAAPLDVQLDVVREPFGEARSRPRAPSRPRPEAPRARPRASLRSHPHVQLLGCVLCATNRLHPTRRDAIPCPDGRGVGRPIRSPVRHRLAAAAGANHLPRQRGQRRQRET